MDIAEFLLARIAEDEAAARQATPGPWWNESGIVHAPYPFGRNDGRPGAACHPLSASGSNGRDSEADAEHASRHHPARVLAKCAADRQIVELHRVETEQHWVHELDGPDHQETEYSCVICGWFPPGSACDTLRLLALPYAGHPDYDEAWSLSSSVTT